MTSSLTTTPRNTAIRLTALTVRNRLVNVMTRSTGRAIAFAIRHTEITLGTKADPSPSAPSAPTAPTVTVVNDPDGLVRLIGVRGIVDARAAALLAATIDAIDDVNVIHIDLSAAEFVPERTIELIERAFDRAERRGLRLRVVGLDPELPALLRRGTR